MIGEELLTAREIAGELDVAVKTVHSWIERQQLPAVRVKPRMVRVRRHDLDAFVQRRQAGKVPPTAAERIRELERAVAELAERLERVESRG